MYLGTFSILELLLVHELQFHCGVSLWTCHLSIHSSPFLLLHYRHFVSHRPLFEHKALNVLSNLYLDPLMGIPPLVFLLHHPVMHHVAINGAKDISSTEPYQRDNWWSFAAYWFLVPVPSLSIRRIANVCMEDGSETMVLGDDLSDRLLLLSVSALVVNVFRLGDFLCLRIAMVFGSCR
mmetsp:Transcript_7400/g.18193  ORF Transcript_7400/g.18193 Transcript_7400/m.18193 type:complete len:179 (+) Transcript_7400:674-1210(+)